MSTLKTYRIYVKGDRETAACEWTWEVFAQYAQLDFVYVSDAASADLSLNGETGPFAYNAGFWDQVRRNEFSHRTVLGADNHVPFPDGTPDYAMTAFYCINCLFERASDVPRDELNRTEYGGSMWKERGIPVTEPFVNKCFDALAGQLNIVPQPRKTQLWFSHDIDVIHGAWMQDGKWLLKRKRLGRFLQVAATHFFRRPQWMNLAQIASAERAKGIRSTFFLLTEKGRIDARRVNADYLLTEKAVKAEIAALRSNGNEIGLHKSLNASTYGEEAVKIGDVWANRNHYLAIQWPQDLKRQQEAGITVDASLGYAEHYGFRNGYSLPFYPFDLETNAPLPVLEIPLNVMDGTFSAYLRKTPEETIALLQAFIAGNSRNTVISVLWHNSHFTDFKYKGFPAVYTQLLELAAANGAATDLTTIAAEFPFTQHTKTPL